MIAGRPQWGKIPTDLSGWDRQVSLGEDFQACGHLIGTVGRRRPQDMARKRLRRIRFGQADTFQKPLQVDPRLDPHRFEHAREVFRRNVPVAQGGAPAVANGDLLIPPRDASKMRMPAS